MDHVARFETVAEAQALVDRMGAWPTARIVEYEFEDGTAYAIAVPLKGQPVAHAERFVRESGLVA
jgi:hypothetical protein